VLEQGSICFQLQAMKKGRGMTFSPSPVFHPKKLADDHGRPVIIVQPCGSYNQS